jgi:hypothetical protein
MVLVFKIKGPIRNKLFQSTTPDCAIDFGFKARQPCFRQFAENELWPIAGKIDKSGEFPAQQVRKMGELGLMGIGKK